jgi:hypothetical protein
LTRCSRHLRNRYCCEPFLVDVIEVALILIEPAREEIFAKNGVLLKSAFSPMSVAVGRCKWVRQNVM